MQKILNFLTKYKLYKNCTQFFSSLVKPVKIYHWVIALLIYEKNLIVNTVLLIIEMTTDSSLTI